jgi:hypothetical protein
MATYYIDLSQDFSFLRDLMEGTELTEGDVIKLKESIVSNLNDEHIYGYIVGED